MLVTHSHFAETHLNSLVTLLLTQSVRRSSLTTKVTESPEVAAEFERLKVHHAAEFARYKLAFELRNELPSPTTQTHVV
jgi:hypothetical protein